MQKLYSTNEQRIAVFFIDSTRLELKGRADQEILRLL